MVLKAKNVRKNYKVRNRLYVIWLFGMIGCFAFGFSNPIAAQEPLESPYSGYLELGGPAGLGSINVERQVYGIKNWIVKGHLGFFLLPQGSLTKVPNSYFYPFGLHLLNGENHQLEIGIGGMVTLNNDGFLEGSESASKWGLYGQGFLGYRWEIMQSDWFLRAGYVPLYHPEMEKASAPSIAEIANNWAHWGSLGIGMRF